MVGLHLQGYLCKDHNGIVALSDTDPNECKYSWEIDGYSIVDSIESFANEYGMTGEHHKGLGGRRAFIDNCNLRAYFTDIECELEEAMMAMDMIMYGGDIKIRIDRCGYSEWMITGLDLEEFSIGGHDLESEFNGHLGEYCHLIIEC